jgi:hypothetical protein
MAYHGDSFTCCFIYIIYMRYNGSDSIRHMKTVNQLKHCNYWYNVRLMLRKVKVKFSLCLSTTP